MSRAKLTTLNMHKIKYKGKSIVDCSKEELQNIVIYLMNERAVIKDKVKKFESDFKASPDASDFFTDFLKGMK